MVVKFIHCADLHLGRVQNQLEQRFVDFGNAFQYVVEEALARRVDFVLVSGDLFDKRNINARTLEQAVKILEPLREAGIRVIAIEGNHDKAFLRDKESWMSFLAHREYIVLLNPEFEGGKMLIEPYDREMCSGCYIDLEDNVRVYGLGYLGRAAGQKLQELADALPADKTNIVLLHAMVGRMGGELIGSIPKGDVACLQERVAYLALGHGHNRYVVGKRLTPKGADGTSQVEASLVEVACGTVEETICDVVGEVACGTVEGTECGAVGEVACDAVEETICGAEGEVKGDNATGDAGTSTSDSTLRAVGRDTFTDTPMATVQLSLFDTNDAQISLFEIVTHETSATSNEIFAQATTRQEETLLAESKDLFEELIEEHVEHNTEKYQEKSALGSAEEHVKKTIEEASQILNAEDAQKFTEVTVKVLNEEHTKNSDEDTVKVLNEAGVKNVAEGTAELADKLTVDEHFGDPIGDLTGVLSNEEVILTPTDYAAYWGHNPGATEHCRLDEAEHQQGFFYVELDGETVVTVEHIPSRQRPARIVSVDITGSQEPDEAYEQILAAVRERVSDVKNPLLRLIIKGEIHFDILELDEEWIRTQITEICAPLILEIDIRANLPQFNVSADADLLDRQTIEREVLRRKVEDRAQWRHLGNDLVNLILEIKEDVINGLPAEEVAAKVMQMVGDHDENS